MPHTATSPTLLDGLYALGERLCLALEAGDVETFACLMQERGALVERLQSFAHPADVDPDWQQHASALQQQHHAIVKAATARKEQFEEALEALGHVKRARARYHKRPARASILNKNLCG